MPSYDDDDLAESQPLLQQQIASQSCGPEGCPEPAKRGNEKELVSNFFVLLYTFGCAIVSLPFAFGSCCWPVFLGLNISHSGIWLCHSLQFAFMLTGLSNLVQFYVYLGQLRRCGSLASQQGPTLCILLSAVLLMVHPMIYLLKDLQIMQPLCGDRLAQGALYACSRVGLLGLLGAAVYGTDGFAVLWDYSASHGSSCSK